MIGCVAGRGLAGLLLLALLTVGCASTLTERSTGEVIDDTTITTKVKGTFVGDPMVSALAITVSTFKGVVSLTGIVNSDAERKRAIQLAEELAGVKEVDARNLFVKR
jgi:osmotically-inducible protein OsmY